jgi:hypothetical protein
MSKSHALDEVLELYTLGKLPDDQVTELEEHLLVCPACCTRLEQTDHYVNATRMAAARIEAHSGGLFRRWLDSLATSHVAKPVWAGAIAVILVAVFLFPRMRTSVSVTEALTEDVPLTVTRGNAAMATAPANHGLRLRIELAELPVRESYRLELVESNGSKVWETTAFPADGRLSVPVQKTLSSGRYWVRLYDQGTMLREFGMDLK